jgi:polar amino acid transport system substrate-binding protein
MLSHVCAVVVWLSGLLWLNVTYAASKPFAHVCVDENPWPPYTYWDANDRTQAFKGYTVELATQVFKSIGLDYDITSMPWTEVHKRAQNVDVQAGCDIVLDISLTSERQAYLYFTNPIYQLHYALVYSSKRFPQGLRVKTLADVNPFRVCGVEGYNYGYLANQLTIIRMSSIQTVLNNLETQYCDIFTVEASVLKYGQKMGLYKLPSVGCTHVEGITKSYRIGISKHFPKAEQWMDSVQRQLDALRSQGKINELVSAHDIAPMKCEQTLDLKP